MELEWIPVTQSLPQPEPSAKRAIKAHVMRRHRQRQRLARAQTSAHLEGTAVQNCDIQSNPACDAALDGQFNLLENTCSPGSSLLAGDTPSTSNSDGRLVEYLNSGVGITHVLASDVPDPFDTLPVELTPRTSALLHHSRLLL